MNKMQTFLRLIYPAQCIGCAALVDSDDALCGACWRETTFINGLHCNTCGTQLPGEDTRVNANCDDCLTIARPWDRGRAALVYDGRGRRLVLALKHGDRTELAHTAAQWMARIMPDVAPDTLIVPVPLHWMRFLKRRYNQSALIAKHLAQITGLTYAPDALHRARKTEMLDGKSRDTRFAMLTDVIHPHPKRGQQMNNRPVLLIDDVMTTGATLAACAEACRGAGATHIDVLVLARVAKDA